MSLTKEQILGAEDTVIKKVSTPKWGGDGCVYVRSLTGDERDLYDKIQTEKRFPAKRDDGTQPEPDWRGLRASLVALALCDEKGTPMGFTELEVMQLGKKNGADLDRCYMEARDLAGLGPDAEEDAGKN